MTDGPASICPYCGVGCGVLPVAESDGWKVRGQVNHPANRGRLCSKGAALGETLGTEGRLLYPQVGGERVSWERALEEVTGRLTRVIAEHGPEAVAFYVSGQLLTEDYYVANKLMKGFIGAANIDTNSRLCMSSAVAAHRRAFGADVVPGCYEDLELADLVVFAGSNAAWTHPVLYQRVAAQKRRRPDLKVVVIDPRHTATCDIADLHLPLAPGTDAALFNGLLAYLYRQDRLDLDYIDTHTEGFTTALRSARAEAASVPAVAAACGLAEADVAAFFQLFAGTERTVTLWSQGLNQSSSGVDKGNAVINCHLATGRIGRPGMGPLSLTGQPNAMGGREVGGLANLLAAHMDFDDPAALARVGRFWRAPRLAERPGLKAVELFDAVDRGAVKAVWIMATNPVVSLPEAERVRAALRRCPNVIVSDCVADTDTAACADILLPAAPWGEKDGTVTNSERCISRVRGFLPPAGEARPDWWIITEVARRLGHADAFDYRCPADIFREHAALSTLDNHGVRAFDIGALATLSDAEYGALCPVQWPVTPEQAAGTPRLYGNGGYHTPTGKARFVPVVARRPTLAAGGDWPLVLNTGRIRDQWHTMTRTGRTPRLTAHLPEPFVALHPRDAAAARVHAGALARLVTAQGTMLARVRIDDGQRPGSVFVPIHWSESHACQSRVGALIPAVIDSLSGQPEFKHAPVRVESFPARWQGFLLCRRPMEPDVGDYRVRVRGREHYRYELAGLDGPIDWGAWVAEHLLGPGEWLEYADPAAGRYRCARIHHGRLQLTLFVAPDGLPDRSWLGELFAAEHLDDAARMSLLAGRPAAGAALAGRLVCSCFNVGLNTLTEAIANDGLNSVESIGAALRAGTNCGSCVPELRDLLGRIPSFT